MSGDSEVIACLQRRIKFLERREANGTRFWLRAAREALAGDTRALRNRVEMLSTPAVEVELSRLTGRWP